jgi:hypothetical protein
LSRSRSNLMLRRDGIDSRRGGSKMRVRARTP